MFNVWVVIQFGVTKKAQIYSDKNTGKKKDCVIA